MRRSERKAWTHLVEDERNALVLSLANGKSSWESGEILKKAHYKYLEIFTRAKTFFKIFTGYYDLYPEKFIDATIISCNPTVRDYLIYTMRDRLKPSIAYKKTQNDVFCRRLNREKMITFEIQKWATSKNPNEVYLYHFVKEFDRWNNFRILPKDIQEPHAFKRRNKNWHKALLKQWYKTKPSVFERYLADFKANYKVKQTRLGYTYLIENGRTQQFLVVPINKEDKEVMSLCNDRNYYVFGTYKDCLEFVELIITFKSKDEKHCRDGLSFWPVFRAMIKKAINFKEVEGITKDRPYLVAHQKDTDANTRGHKEYMQKD